MQLMTSGFIGQKYSANHCLSSQAYWHYCSVNKEINQTVQKNTLIIIVEVANVF